MKTEFYKYRWEIKFQIPSRKIEFIPLSVLSVKKTCDYLNNFIPHYELDVKMLDQDLQIFKIYDKELIVSVKQIMMYGIDRDNLDQKKIIFEDIFIPFYDKSVISNESREEKIVKTGEETTVGYIANVPNQMAATKFHMNLLLKKDLLMKKYMHNYILGSDEAPTTPASAVAFLIDQNPHIDEYIMDKPDNTSAYSDMIIKPNELKNAIRQVQINYGIYGKDLMIFYDNGLLYILNKYEKEHSYQKDEITLVKIDLDTRRNRLDSMDEVKIDEKKKIISYERSGAFQVDDKEVVLGETVGDKIVFSNFGSIINSAFGADGKTQFVSPLNVIDRPTQSNVNTGVKIIPDYDMINNPWLMASRFYSTNLGVPIVFALKGINSEHFAPNKRIMMNFKTPEESKLYAGTYNIASANFLYSATGENNCRYDTYCHVGLELINPEKLHNTDYVAKSAK